MLNVVFSLINSLPLRIAFGLYKMWQRNVGKQGRRDKKIRKKTKKQRSGEAKKGKSEAAKNGKSEEAEKHKVGRESKNIHKSSQAQNQKIKLNRKSCPSFENPFAGMQESCIHCSHPRSHNKIHGSHNKISFEKDCGEVFFDSA